MARKILPGISRLKGTALYELYLSIQQVGVQCAMYTNHWSILCSLYYTVLCTLYTPPVCTIDYSLHHPESAEGLPRPGHMDGDGVGGRAQHAQ